MSKEEKKQSSFDDFSAENLLDTATEEVETPEVEEEKEEIEEKPKVKAKVEKIKEESKPIKKGKEEPKETPEDEVEETKESEEETQEETEEDSDPKKFFEEVSKITGSDVDVDYGDTDPLSPQGVALREQAVKESAIESILEEIESNHPKAWQVLKHSYNGGDPAELFAQTLARDYSKVDLKEGDDELAKTILTEYYKGKGVNENKIKKLIEADEDTEGGIVKEAQGVLKELREQQESSRNEIAEKQEQQAAAQKKRDQVFVSAVDSQLETRQLGNFKLTSNTEAAEFRSFVLSNIRKTTDGRYEIAAPVDSNNLVEQLKYQYFQFKKGDLSKMIQQKAETVNAEKLKLRISNEKAKVKKATGDDSPSKKLNLESFNSF